MATLALALAVGVPALAQEAARGPHLTPIDQRRLSPAQAEAMLAQIQRADALADDSGRALEARDHTRAEALGRQAVALVPQHGRSWLLLARACEGQGKERDALKAYEALIYPVGWGSSIGTDFTTLARYVLALTRSARWLDAAAVFERAEGEAVSRFGRPLLGKPFNARAATRPELVAAAHYVLGVRSPLFGPADPSDQLAHLAAAVKTLPGWSQAHLAHGQALAKAGRLDEAREACRRAAAKADVALKPQIREAEWELTLREQAKRKPEERVTPPRPGVAGGPPER